MQYKLIHRWYRTPFKFQRMEIMVNVIRWKRHSATGTFMHSVWECQEVYPFWKGVLDYIVAWTGKSIS